MDTVQKLIRLTGTNDPFRIASHLNIPVLFEDLGNIYGYYNMVLRMKQIHINQALSEFDQTFTCSHELGHAVALDLRIGNDVLLEHCHYTTSQLANMLGYPEELIKLRVNEWMKFI